MQSTIANALCCLSSKVSALSAAEDDHAMNGGKSALLLRRTMEVAIHLREVLRRISTDSWAAEMSGADLSALIGIVDDARCIVSRMGLDNAGRPLNNASKRGAIVRDAEELADVIMESARGVQAARNASGMPHHATPVGKFEPVAKHSTWSADGREVAGCSDAAADNWHMSGIATVSHDYDSHTIARCCTPRIARLLIAAPAMLAALRGIDSAIGEDRHNRTALEAVRAAIAKVEG